MIGPLGFEPRTDGFAELTRAGHRIEVETNGTIQPIPSLRRNVAQWNVSPKLANSGNAARRRIVAPLVDAPLRWFGQSQNAWFKFVIDVPADLDEVTDLVTNYAVPKGARDLDASGRFGRGSRRALVLACRRMRPPRLPVLNSPAHSSLGRRAWPVGEHDGVRAVAVGADALPYPERGVTSVVRLVEA